MSQSANLSPIERIQQVNLLLRGEKVMLDADLAALYGVQTKVPLKAMKRNSGRFPDDFVFQLSSEEFAALRSQIVISKSQVVDSQSPQSNWSQFVTSSQKHRGTRYRPYAFTEQGVAMVFSVLRSQRAVEVNVAIMRAFVALRRLLSDNAALAKKLAELERKVIGHDAVICSLFDAIRQLMAPPLEILNAPTPSPRTSTRARKRKTESATHPHRQGPAFDLKRWHPSRVEACTW